MKSSHFRHRQVKGAARRLPSADLRGEFLSTVKEVAGDAVVAVADRGIELLLSAPDLVEAIPFAGTLFRFTKGVIALSDAFFAVRICKFFQTFRDGSVDPEHLAAFIRDLEQDWVYLDRVTKVTIQQIQAHNDELKSIILAELLKAHVRHDLDFGGYQFLAFAVTALNPMGFAMLADLVERPDRGLDPLVGATLVGTGLAGYSSGAFMGNDGRAFPTRRGHSLYDHALTKLSKNLYREQATERAAKKSV